MEKEKTIFLQYMGDSPKTRILDFLINGRMFDYNLTDIANKSGVSWSTFKRVWPSFILQGLVEHTRDIGNAKLFKLNFENPIIEKVLELREQILKEAQIKEVVMLA